MLIISVTSTIFLCHLIELTLLCLSSESAQLLRPALSNQSSVFGGHVNQFEIGNTFERFLKNKSKIQSTNKALLLKLTVLLSFL